MNATLARFLAPLRRRRADRRVGTIGRPERHPLDGSHRDPVADAARLRDHHGRDGQLFAAVLR